MADDGRRGASAAERIEVMDALRGFALAGILSANILFWSGWELMTPAQIVGRLGPERAAQILFWHKLLIDGKFYTIFSLLFGAGFALQLARLEARGADGIALFRRRVAVLLGFGLIHLVLVWEGDILTLYAALGFLLPLVRGWSDRRLVWAGVALLLLPLPGEWLRAALGWHPEAPFASAGVWIVTQVGGPSGEGDLVAWLARPDWYSRLQWDASAWCWRIFGLIQGWRIPKVLGVMLIGMVVGRRLGAGSLPGDRRLLWRVLLVGLLIGLPATYVYAKAEGVDQAGAAAVIGTAPLGFAYAAAFVLAWPWARPVLRVLIAPGRMALTNYLAQTVMGVAIFYGIGLGLVGRVSPFQTYAIAAAIFAIELVWSPLWLRRFAQGPTETLWRRLTYAGRARD